MLLDLIYAVIIVLAILHGYSRGLIVGLFSLVAIIIGLAAAMKLSIVAGGYISRVINISEEWLPIISFAVVFLIVILLIRLGARAIEKTIQIAMLGWVNKIGGILFYVAIYTIIITPSVF